MAEEVLTLCEVSGRIFLGEDMRGGHRVRNEVAD